MTLGTVTFQSCQIYSNTAHVRSARRHQTRDHAHPIALMGCLHLLTCYVWLPCMLAECKLTASYT